MYFKPHKLYIHKPGESYQDDDGNWVTSEPSTEYLCDCRKDMLSIEKQQGYSGKAIIPKHKVVMEKRDDLKYGDEVEVFDKITGKSIAKGSIVDITADTSSFSQLAGIKDYTVIYV